MRVWRICREPHAPHTLTGRGGLFASGRWHGKGRPIVYTSATLALAALEVLVNAARDLVPDDLVRIEIDLPDDVAIARIEVSGLPADWRSFPAPPALQRLGDAWLAESATPVLEVPSAVIPEESNFLLNPQHPDAAGVAVVSTRRFAFDTRLANFGTR